MFVCVDAKYVQVSNFLVMLGSFPVLFACGFTSQSTNMFMSRQTPTLLESAEGGELHITPLCSLLHMLLKDKYMCLQDK